MAAGDLDPQVVLTADTSQYDQAMAGSASSTDNLAKSVDALTSKISSLTKSAGRGLMKVAVADVAGITAATAAFANYEKQMAGLQAQAAVLNRTMGNQERTFASYERSVTSLRTTFGTTTRDAAALTLAISKMADHTTGISQLSNTFQKMSNATGEASTTLANSVLNLGRVMGTPQRDTKAYADQLTTLAAGANTTASSLADFASQLAPIGRMVGMSQTEITGVATAFTKAGQDGYQASTAFSKIMSDIAYATQTGSPDLAKYSNLIGVTMSQFKDMGGAEQAIKIFDKLNELGPRGITELNKLGLDGMRMMKSITALSQQSGGIGSSIQQAQAAYGDNSVNRGSKAAMQGMTDEFGKLRQELTLTAEAFGKTFAPAAEMALKVMVKMAGVLKTVLDGPLGDLAKILAAVVAPMAAVTGGLLLMAGALAKLAAGALLIRGAGFRGLVEGFRGGAAVARPGATQVGQLGETGAQIAARGSWLQRDVFYNPMARIGQFAGGIASGARGGQGPGSLGGFLRGGANLGMNTMAGGISAFGTPIYSPLTMKGWDDPTQRSRLIQSQRFTDMFRGAQGTATIGGQGGAVLGSAAGRAAQAGLAGASGVAANAAAVQQAQRLNVITRNLTGGFGNLAKATGTLAGNMVSAAGQVAKSAGGLAARGVMGAVSSMGGLNAAMLGASIAIPVGMALKEAFDDDTVARFQDLSGGGNAYRRAAGLTDASVFQPQMLQPGTAPVNQAQARQISPQDLARAKMSSHKVQDTGQLGMTEAQTVSYLASNWAGYANDPAARQAAKLDLLDRFDTNTAQRIIDQLDQGAQADVGAFLDSSTDLGGMSKEDAGKLTSGALGVVEGAANVAAATGGAGAFFRTKGTGLAEILGTTAQGVGKGATGSEASAMEMIGEQLFGKGTLDFAEAYGKISVTPDRATGIYGPSQFAGAVAAGVETPEQQAALFSTMIEELQVKGIEGAEEATTQLLSRLGVSGEVDITDQAEVNKAILEALTQGDDPANEYSTRNRIRDLGRVGGVVAGSDILQRAEGKTGDIQLQYEAIDEIYNKSIGKNKDILDVYSDLGDVQGEIGDSAAHSYQIIDAVMQRMQQDSAMRQQLMSRPQQLAETINVSGEILASDNPNMAPQQQAAKQQVMQSFVDQASYFKQMLLQQDQFELSRERAQADFATSRQRMDDQYHLSRARAQEDFALGRQQQEEDYQLGRRRAEDAYELSRERGTSAYHRSMNRAQSEFNRSRRRGEADYQHSVELMIEQSAQSMYNIFDRVSVQRTSSSGYLLVNAQDQLEKMQKQAQDLDAMRALGVTDQTIQQLGLGKAENAQQLARMVAEFQMDPTLAGQMNDAIAARMAAAGELVTDESSQEWEEFTRQYELSVRRASNDFERQVRQSHKDFRRQMKEMEDDFQLSMANQATDYETAQERQQKQFSKSMSRGAEDYATAVDQMVTDFGKSMTRAQEDMDLMAKNISGNLKEILTRAATELSGTVGAQATAVLNQFNNLDETLGSEGVEIMINMSKIFGFDYTPPKWYGQGNKKDGTREEDTGFGPQTGAAGGGVLPGRSIGRDNMHFYSKEHGGLNLAGGEAIMVPEWVEAMGGPAAIKEMNRQARYGRSFAQGGPIPAVGTWNQHTSGYPWATWAGDINVPGEGDLGNPVRAYKAGMVTAANDWNYSYGKHIRINSGDQNFLYAHLSKMLVEIGDMVTLGQLIGNVGTTGNSSGPHLHFEIAGGDFVGPPSPTTGKRGLPGIKGLLEDYYPNVEKAAAGVKLGGGLFKDGFWSKRINDSAKQTYHKLKKGKLTAESWNAEGGVFSDPSVIGVGEQGPEMVLPLNDVGAAFLIDLMKKTTVGLDARGTNLNGSAPIAAHTLNTYQIDRSATFSGDITVVSSNVNDLVNQLRQHQRVRAMQQPAMAGTRS